MINENYKDRMKLKEKKLNKLKQNQMWNFMPTI